MQKLDKIDIYQRDVFRLSIINQTGFDYVFVLTIMIHFTQYSSVKDSKADVKCLNAFHLDSMFI